MSKDTKNSYEDYRSLLFNRTGINVNENKQQMLMTKISRILRRKQIDSIEEYYKLLVNTNNQDDIQEFVDAMTTNTTEFFREKSHFDFITQKINFILDSNKRISKSKEIRVWSAGCSTGQEPITLAIVLSEVLGSTTDIKILATDISTKVLNKCMTGIYPEAECEGIPKNYLNKYFVKHPQGYKVSDEILSLIKYRQFNLMEDYSFKKDFDMIFCRNVMIYFDNKTQEVLLNKFYSHLVNGGLMFIGHSESLINKKHSYKYVEPSVYMKP